MKQSFLLIGCAVFFTGCTVHGPSVDLPSVDVPGISIDSPVKVAPSSYEDDDHNHKHKHKGGKGCPPGLRKQGRC